MTRWRRVRHPVRPDERDARISLQNSPNHVLVPYGLASPPPISSRAQWRDSNRDYADGTQIWRIFHNGVDTHTIHTHLFHTQLVNALARTASGTARTGSTPLTWAGKDTFKVNPLEITYLAMRPTVPTSAQLRSMCRQRALDRPDDA